MEGMKGKLLKKLKSIKPPPMAIGYLKQQHDHFIAVATPEDGYVHNLIKTTILKSRQHPHNRNVPSPATDADKENACPKDMPTKVHIETSPSPNRRHSEYDSSKNKTPLSEIDISGFRRPDLNSCSLFDPNLLAAFEQAVKEYFWISEQARRRSDKAENIESNSKGEEDEEEEPPAKSLRIEEEEIGSSLGFQGNNNNCPPGGRGSVVFYTTSLRGIRKTFEECSQVRFLLESFRIVYYERDVSMHSEFKEELQEILGKKGMIPPRLFVKGRYIGGAEEVVRLHEQGRLRPLLEGVELKQREGVCQGCGGIRFVICPDCKGSHKIIAEKGSASCCSKCNENGLMVCPMCMCSE